MKNTNKLATAYCRAWALAWMLMGMCLVLCMPGANAQTGTGFDHAATAFPLLGAHEQVRCESCHIKGIFKTTPRDCVGCHVANNQRGAVAMPYRHIQVSTSCDTCHNVSSFAAVLFNHSGVAPGTCRTCHDGTRASGQSANHMPTNLSCDACHSSVSFLPVQRFAHAALKGDLSTCAGCHNGQSATGMPVNHIPRANPAQCGSCHKASTLTEFKSFAGAKMDHSGMTTGCADCHGPNVTGSTFAGITSIIVMPPTSPAGMGSHIPASTACENCHLGSLPPGLVEANAGHAAPGSGFASPAPTSAQIHAGVTSGCSNCHEANTLWMGMSAYPIAPATLKSGVQYRGFQTRPMATAGTYNVADAAHPATGDCSQCHTGTNYFTAQDKPANHMPTAATAQCTACHTSSDYAVLPTLDNIHANAPSTTGNCAQCHAANVVAGFAIPAANFTIVGPPSNHIPTSAACETCHVGAGSSIASLPVGNGARFSGSLMSHTGITSNCAACHGPGITGGSFVGISRIVVMPPTSPVGPNAHIPSSTTCETCHLATAPTELIAASATRSVPGSLFATPAPTTVQIHTGITSGCSACHDTNFVWMGMSAYPIAPTTLSSGAQYTGFQTRPKAAAGTYNVADPVHPSTGDCSQCHSGTNYFTAQDKPANHIPTAATAQCTACHTTGDFAVMPTLANIHANAPSTTGNCAQCHAANVVAGFAIPAANFTIVGPPSNHIPTSAACETCHVGAGSSIASLPVGNGARFSGSLMSHTGISSNCATCHGPSITGSSFAGISNIVVMPPTAPVGPNAHIPSSTTCETCHLATTPSGLLAASAARSVPGSLFATPAPTTVQIHSGITGNCAACHDTNYVWMGVNAYPIAPTVLTAGAQYTGFQTRPKATAGTFNIADAAHPGTGDCSQCHSGTNYFTALDKPVNHIPTAPTAQCTACHTTGDFAVMPTLANIHANAPSTTGNCAQCHAANVVAGFAIPAANFTIVGPPSNHIPTSAACETCHVGAGSSIASLPVGNGARFSGSLMSHTGISSNCATCHGPSITGSSFAGISNIVVMPPTAPVGPNAHIPSSTTCETCHLATTPSGLLAASATRSVPGSLFATPAPTTVQIHSGITGNCAACHDTNYVWMGVNAYPIAPTVLTAGAQYTGFQTRPKATAGTFNIADAAHPGTGDCSQCHSGTNYFTALDKPTNHIPTAPTAQCTACHTTGDFAVMPTLANIHANAPSTTGNCAQCHAANVVAGFAIPAANFTIVGPPANHIPTTGACETCHVGAGSSIASLPVGNGARFSGSLMSHTGISSNCATCHGPSITGSSFAGISNIVVMPPTAPVGPNAHIPSSTTCETCHLATTPSGLLAASATRSVPGSLFATPAPTTVQIHTGVTGNCAACHDTNYVWMGVNAYPIAPTVLTAGAQYTGFQTRPKAAAGTYNVADPVHPSTGDCSQCHSGTNYFTALDKPTNHIPTAPTAQCTACHTTGDFAVMPTLANIHANAPSTTGNCAQCHAANVVAGFAIPAANFTIVGPPANHIPTTGACETCHVGAGSSIASLPVGNGARFSGSLMSHTGISSNCATCHGPSITGSSFAGISNIVVMPPTAPVGPNAHIPSSTTCETCHLATTPSGLLAASAARSVPGSLFATPAPTTVQIHSGITGNCAACHDTNFVWMGMGAYPIAPSTLTAGAQYTGFQTRPKATAGTFNIADAAHPGTGDCSQCHSGTNYFTALDKPTNHIPVSATAQCTACHTTGDFAVMPTLANIHANAPSTTGNCAQCHAANVVAGFAIPAANFTIVGPPTNHIPITTACETCHVGAGSSIASLPVGNGARFSGSLMSHSGISSNCAACHGPSITGSSFAGISRIVVLPASSPVGAGAHIPSSTTCETCHLGTTPSGLVAASTTKSVPGSLFATPAPTTVQIHTGVTGGCAACHDTNYVWMGVNAYPIAPTTLTAGAQYTGFQTRPKAAAGTYNVADVAHPGTGDCSQCHSGTNYFTALDKPVNHIPTSPTAQCTACHTSTDYAVLPTLANIHANAPSTTGNCAQCHAANVVAGFAIPAANFTIVGPPANHIPTTGACESCHVGAGSSIASLPVGNGARFSGSLMSHSGISSNCAACHGPSITGSSFAGISRIVVMPASSPVGAGAHIPSSTTCETCHLGTTPSGLVAASATRSVPGSLFATPAPTTVQIHTGVTGGCAACHDTNYVWMGVNAYPIAPTVLTAGAQYTGFQTRPKATAGTFNIADAAHPGTGDCAQCHSGTNYFTALDKPTNHIPVSATAQCTACHTTGDFAVMPTLANIHANAPSTTGNCAQCHAANVVAGFAIPAANFTIVGPPTNHIPITTACETCHVGAGSSIASLPVGNGARFSGSLMSHSGISSNCAACHGPSITGSSFAGISRIVVMPATAPVGVGAHIPSSTTCETCHLGTTPSGLVAASATRSVPGSLFATPAPTTVQIHTGVTGGCAACHDTNYVWMGVNAYPIAPTTLTSGAQYTGFQTRPKASAGTYNVADAVHPSTGDCSQCHSGTNYFTAVDKPANHIPTAATAQCTACHTTPGDFVTLPTLANIHANAPSTTGNCALCHAANVVAGFAIPAANFSIVGPPANHIPTSAACESCHVGTGSSIASLPVGNGARFSGSLMSHSGISSNCAACHGPSITGSSFAGISRIVVLPPTSPVGAGAHIPSSTTCETCHLATTPSGLLAASATRSVPGSLFATPAPTTVQIHSGITGNCAACHDTNYVWMGVNAYPIAPTVLTAGAQYTGFQTRPKAAAGTYNVADPVHPSTGDCSQCHSGTNYFTAVDKPANHIPTAATAQCTACHTTPGDFVTLPTLANIHANAPSTTGNCALCHAANVVAGFAIPAANFTIVGPPANHIPITTACETCHVGAGSSVTSLPVGNGARFSGSLMSHSGISSNCAACHGPSITGSSFAGISRIVVLPPTSPVGAGAHIPSSTTCETCHLGTTPSGLVAASTTKSVPGSLFATPAPTTVQIHTGVTGGCAACHDTNYVWMGVNAYPIAPTTLTAGAQYTGFQTRPKAAAGTYNVADVAHPGTGDCSQCHSGTNYFTALDKPVNHIPTAATAQCTACHTTPGDFVTLPTLANIHANAPSTTGNCAQCHAANVVAGFAIPAANFTIVGPPANHIPTTGACESCHVGAGSSIASLPVGNGARFSGSLMSHSGISSNCAACHGPSITGSSFAGISRIVVLPPTAPVGAGAHIPSSTTCETCHLGTTPSGLVAASTTKSVPGSLFATPAPTTVQIHTGVTGGCAACHDTNYVWMGVNAYPIAPTTLTAGAQYTGFQTRPKAAAGTYNVADVAHPGTGDCSQCHTGTNFFVGELKPANHIPTSPTAQCTACHTTPGDFVTLPTLANIHANAPSTTGNCAQCHAANVVAGFAIPAANFTIVGPPANHIPTTGACESCHVGAGSSIASLPVGNGARFSGSLMSHSGISSNCAACHGPSITGSSFAGISRIVVLPPTAPVGAGAHIPSSTTCETCHLGTTPSGLVAASTTKSVPGSLFATPAPTTVQIHSGITGNCAACHDTNYVWMGVNAYPIAPTTLTAGAQYTGFHSRPKATAGTFNIADAAHPSTGDCSQCHTGTNFFVGELKPANHIPTSPTAQCTACHTTPGDFVTLPTLANIHANAPSTTGNCAQCHAANVVAGFAIPAANFTIVGPPANHIPTTGACESCHVGAGSSIASLPVGNGARFSGSLMSHSGISSNCAACHGPSITGSSFAGISRIVVMPASSPVGAGAHIPSSTTCETCHLGTTPSGLVAASATRSVPGSLFATPASTTVQIHSGITSGCSTCHDTNFVWMGMSAYPIAPTTLTAGAQYTGFHSRPKATAGTFNIADAAHPSTGDCSQCHNGTNYFTGLAKPAGHIPTSAPCTNCHIVPGDYSIAGLASNAALHTGITSGCISCHSVGAGAGPFAGCATQANCASPPPLTYQPKATPLAAGGSPTAPSPQTHVPAVGIACEKCHSPTVFTSFAGMNMKGNTPAHTAVAAATCMSCHEYLYTWYGVTIRTPGSASHHGRRAGQDCTACHARSYTQFDDAARVRPVMRGALNTINQRVLPGGGLGASIGQGDSPAFSHVGVLPGQCRTCHNSQTAKGIPPRHVHTTMSCDACHRTTTWTPAQFSHQGVLPGQCQVCHNNAAATGKPGRHFVTARSCDACHRTVTWVPVTYSHLSPLYQPQADKPTCVSCHVTNGELIPRVMRGNNRPKLPGRPGP